MPDMVLCNFWLFPKLKSHKFLHIVNIQLWRVTDFQTLSAFRVMRWPSGRAFQKRASRTIMSSGNTNWLHNETEIVSVQAVTHSCHRIFLELNCHTSYNINNMPWEDKIILFQITLWTCRFFLSLDSVYSSLDVSTSFAFHVFTLKCHTLKKLLVLEIQSSRNTGNEHTLKVTGVVTVTCGALFHDFITLGWHFV